MAVHKVPQDVEADDKLIGPFSFKQFAFLMVAAGFFFMTFLAFRISPIVGVLPLPFALIFLVLGIPLRKDQPTDVYVAALINYWLKPKTRIWGQEGQTEHVNITVPKKIEKEYTDGLSRVQVKGRLTELAKTMDTRGWSSKNIDSVYNPITDSDRLVAATFQPSVLTADETHLDDVLDPLNSRVGRSLARMEAGTKLTDDVNMVVSVPEPGTQYHPDQSLPHLRTVSEIADIAEAKHPISHQPIAPIYTGHAQMPPTIEQQLHGPPVPVPPPNISTKTAPIQPTTSALPSPPPLTAADIDFNPYPRGLVQSDNRPFNAKPTAPSATDMTNSGQADIIEDRHKELEEGGEVSLR